MMPGIGDTPLVGTDTGTYSGGGSDTQTVFVGASGSSVGGTRKRGFIYSSLGSISDGTSDVCSGALIRELAAEEANGMFNVIFAVTGSFPNSGWNTMNIGGSFILSRADASFLNSVNTSWEWLEVGNPFGDLVGQPYVVGFD